MKPIEVRGQATVRDHLDALRVIDRRHGPRWVTPAICLSIPTFFVALSLLQGHSLREALLANVFWIVLGVWLLLTLPFAARWAARSIIKGNPAATAPQLYRFTEAGFEERECPVEVSVSWSAMTDAVETPSVLLLFTGRSSAFIVPARDLAAAGQADAVQALLRERLGDRARLLPGNQTRRDPTLGEVPDLPGGWTRFQGAFLALVLAQSAHSAEEYIGRLWQSFPPARFVSGLISQDLERGFLLANIAIVAFGLWCWLWPVRRGWRVAVPLLWGWVMVEVVNGVGHILWALAQGGYTPGVATAPLLFLLATYLGSQLRQVGQGA